MVIAGTEPLDRNAAVLDQFRASTQIDDRPHADRGDAGEIGTVDAVDPVGPVQLPPTHCSITGRVATEVAEVENALEGDPAGPNVGADTHVRNVPGSCNTQLADS